MHALVLPLLLALAHPGPPPLSAQDRFLADEDLEPLAASLRAYREARSAGTGVEQARAEVAGRLVALEALLEGGHPLKRSSDLGRALWLSRDYDEGKPRKGRVSEDVFERRGFGGAGMEYAYRLPKDYDPEVRAYPLILAIPDAGETPAGHLRSRWTLREILDGAILLCPAMPVDREEWDQVSIDGRPGGLSHVMSALRVASERFAVDFERVFVAGTGKGVPAAIAAGNTSPQRFAGIIGRAGDAGELGPENFGNLPTFFAGAGSRATAFQEAVRAAGHDHCVLAAAGTEEDLWRWMLEHPRRAHPEEVSLVVGKPLPTRAYWLRVAPTAPDAQARGVIERQTNSVRITCTGVSRVTLYLNDALLDLDEPVRVVCNDVERTAVLSRRLADFLDLMIDGTSDPASAYVVEAVFDTAQLESPPAASAAAADPEFDEHLAAAAGRSEEPEELWELALWCEATGRAARRQEVLRRLLRLVPDHAEARAALGHVGSDGIWFPSRPALERHLARQDDEQAAAMGSVRHKVGWIHPDERSLANKGWVKDWPTGQWLSGADRKRLADGWVRQDLDWIPPDEAHHRDEGLWKVDGEWVSLEVANRRHAKLEAMWRIPGPEVVLYSTADRDVALRAMEQMARALSDLHKVFGAVPVLPLRAAVLRDEEQYDRFAFGDPDGRREATDTARMHVIHGAYFAESWFPRVDGELEFEGMGVCTWDPLVPYGDLYGVHAARLAFGLSYVDALDPSPKTVKKALSKGPGPDYHEAYEDEKRLPAWLRYGGAVYAERYFHDPGVQDDNDPWWARNWSLDNLRNRGGLRPLDEVFAFPIDPADRDDGLKLLLEAGLLVAFLVDGEVAPVRAAHAELVRDLLSEAPVAKDLEDLEQVLREHESELRAFGGL